jgi:magnesium transporter
LLQKLEGAQIHELHWQDLLNNQLPSHYDHTSSYDIMVFRRLARGRSETDVRTPGAILHRSRELAGPEILNRIDTSPIGFLVFEQLVISVHPTDCAIRDHFIQKLTGPGGRHGPSQPGSSTTGKSTCSIPTTASTTGAACSIRA